MNERMKFKQQLYATPAVHVVRLEQSGIICKSSASVQANEMTNDNYYNNVFEYEN